MNTLKLEFAITHRGALALLGELFSALDADAQFGAPFGATRFEDFAPTLGLHAFAKAVNAHAVNTLGLINTFQENNSSSIRRWSVMNCHKKIAWSSCATSNNYTLIAHNCQIFRSHSVVKLKPDVIGIRNPLRSYRMRRVVRTQAKAALLYK